MKKLTLLVALFLVLASFTTAFASVQQATYNDEIDNPLYQGQGSAQNPLFDSN